MSKVRTSLQKQSQSDIVVRRRGVEIVEDDIGKKGEIWRKISTDG